MGTSILAHKDVTYQPIFMFCNFISSPIYIYWILVAQDRVYENRILYEPSSTKADFKVLNEVCINPVQGNIENWLKFEILAFYSNLLVLMLYLAKS